jgi:hypothetical protein
VIALILICSAALATNLGTCTPENATMVMRVPTECATPATCFMNAQAYLAQTSVGRELEPDDRIKIVCINSTSISTARQAQEPRN